MAKQCGYSRAGTPPLRLYTYTSNLHLALDLSSRRASVKDASRGGAFDIMVVWKRSFIPFALRFRISVFA